jgi:hypothetical protein
METMAWARVSLGSSMGMGTFQKDSYRSIPIGPQGLNASLDVSMALGVRMLVEVCGLVYLIKPT